METYIKIDDLGAPPVRKPPCEHGVYPLVTLAIAIQVPFKQILIGKMKIIHRDWDCAQITRLVNSEAAAHHDFAEDLWKRSGRKRTMARRQIERRNEQMPIEVNRRHIYIHT